MLISSIIAATCIVVVSSVGSQTDTVFRRVGTPLLECLEKEMVLMSIRELNDLYRTILKLAPATTNFDVDYDHLETDCSMTQLLVLSVSGIGSPLTLPDSVYQGRYMVNTSGTIDTKALSRDLTAYLDMNRPNLFDDRSSDPQLYAQDYGPRLWSLAGLDRLYAADAGSLSGAVVFREQIERLHCILLGKRGELASEYCLALFTLPDGQVHGIFGQQPTGETLITLVLPIIDHILTIEKQPDERFVIYQSSVQAFNLPNYLFNECHEAHLHYPQFRADCTRNPYGDGKVLSRREMSNWLADLKLLLRSLHRNQNVQASRWLFERLFWSEPRNYLSNFISTFRHQPLVFTVHESDGVSCPLAFKRLKSI